VALATCTRNPERRSCDHARIRRASPRAKRSSAGPRRAREAFDAHPTPPSHSRAPSSQCPSGPARSAAARRHGRGGLERSVSVRSRGRRAPEHSAAPGQLGVDGQAAVRRRRAQTRPRQPGHCRPRNRSEFAGWKRWLPEQRTLRVLDLHQGRRPAPGSDRRGQRRRYSDLGARARRPDGGRRHQQDRRQQPRPGRHGLRPLSGAHGHLRPLPALRLRRRGLQRAGLHGHCGSGGLPERGPDASESVGPRVPPDRADPDRRWALGRERWRPLRRLPGHGRRRQRRHLRPRVHRRPQW